MVAEEINFDINGTISVAAVWSTVYLVLNVFLIISGLKRLSAMSIHIVWNDNIYTRFALSIF